MDLLQGHWLFFMTSLLYFQKVSGDLMLMKKSEIPLISAQISIDFLVLGALAVSHENIFVLSEGGRGPTACEGSWYPAVTKRPQVPEWMCDLLMLPAARAAPTAQHTATVDAWRNLLPSQCTEIISHISSLNPSPWGVHAWCDNFEHNPPRQ